MTLRRALQIELAFRLYALSCCDLRMFGAPLDSKTVRKRFVMRRDKRSKAFGSERFVPRKGYRFSAAWPTTIREMNRDRERYSFFSPW